MSALEDQHDAQRVLSGDLAAFEGIVRRWQAPLIHLAYRFCHDRGRAEEMAQEAFLRAFRHLSSWRGESAFSTWLFALATNLYRTELRRQPPMGPALEDVPEPQDLRQNSSAAYEARRQQEVVQRAVATLPPKYREVLVLYYFHEMDVPTTAGSLSLPEGTVKARLFRARELLRSKLRSFAEPLKTEPV